MRSSQVPTTSLQLETSFYREATKLAGLGLNHSLARQYIEVQALLITPIAPHWTESIWLEVLQKPTTIQNARCPDLGSVNPRFTATQAYIRSTKSSITSAESAQQRRLAKGQARPSIIDKKDMKKAMPLIQTIKKRLDSGEDRSEVFDRKLPFNEVEVLEEMAPALKQVIRGCDEVVVMAVQVHVQTQGLPSVAETAEPGNPAFYFENA
ncbi:hypothetical protein CC80DRAFT_554605 [Byssothecium circinans]|uniref:Methionyl/Valyl/Leucyl/Isoleucyl-tRNA synthetase anticodon-binding domain-containing protein n=1 Tax=Byssothecium circinans TaxID=147558 RepID=A0A6A5TBG2_9PLEO|nr:hypothetical protein CC80DRAFT_554605 [Byssothecium circinans]